MFGLGAGEVVIILVLALIFIGPKKLPELARSLGKSLREFQKAKDELMNEIESPPKNESTRQIDKTDVSNSTQTVESKEEKKSEN